jgi:hypothetical protein
MRSERVLPRSWLAAAFAALVTCGLGTTQAQYDRAPFQEAPLEISAVYGAEMAVIRLRAADALFAEEDVEEDDVEEVLEGLELEWMRMGHRLTETDAELAERVEEAFEEIEEADDPDDAVAEAIEVAEAARDALFPPAAVSEDPAYTAAIATVLLNSATGVAEGYEEATEGEIGAYAMGWAGLARVQELWQGVRPVADENQRFEVEDMLSELEALFPGPTPPSMEGADPEAGEGAAVQAAGFMEDATEASMFPDRDLAALTVATRDLAAQGCEAYEAGDALRGHAHMAWTAFVFDEYIGGTLGMFAPEPTEEMAEALMDLVPREVEEEGEEGEDEEAEAEEDEEEEEAERLEADEAAERCAALVEAMDEAGAAFGL